MSEKPVTAIAKCRNRFIIQPFMNYVVEECGSVNGVAAPNLCLKCTAARRLSVPDLVLHLL